MSPTQEQFLAELESLGVGAVKERIATNVYLGGLRDIAQGWVERKEAKASEEQLSLARRAYTAAEKSNWIAAAAFLVAVISLLVALFKR
jgi:hypothetical protein